eukprot:scaffold59458_cov64-Phaeocystis_antarctica.AAC.6
MHAYLAGGRVDDERCGGDLTGRPSCSSASWPCGTWVLNAASFSPASSPHRSLPLGLERLDGSTGRVPSASRSQEPGESASGGQACCATLLRPKLKLCPKHNALPATGVSATDGGRSSLSAAAAISGPPSAAPSSPPVAPPSAASSAAPSRPPSGPPPESLFRRRRCFLERRGCAGAGAASASALLGSRRRAGGCSRVCPPSKSSLR